VSWLPKCRPRDIVLLYHRIARIAADPWGLCVTPEHFVEHLEVLRKCQRISLDQIHVREWFNGRRAPRVAITFDDGYADNLYEAAPLLEQYDTPAIYFIATGYMGGTREFWWDELERIVFQSKCQDDLEYPLGGRTLSWRRPPNTSHEAWYFELYDRLQPLPHEVRRDVLDRMLDWSGQDAAPRPSHRSLTGQEIAALSNKKLFEIGAHTVTHPVLAAQPLGDQYMELQESKGWLETLLGRSITSLSYPYGGNQHYTAETVRAAHAVGFTRACSVSGHVSTGLKNRYELPRVNVTDMDGEAFERLLFA
jgi:peptidoglycan/xylan/chitin deacetylase (PgdA/CDA1 family)